MRSTRRSEDEWRTLREIEQLYAEEADILDRHDLAEWLTFLHPAFRYEVPVPVVRDDTAREQYSTEGLLAVETRPSIELWVKRLSPALVETAFAENPPVRSRHLVGNVRVAHAADGRLTVDSNVLLTWCRGSVAPSVLSGHRVDTLVPDGDEWLLLHRRVLVDTNVVHLDHLRVIL